MKILVTGANGMLGSSLCRLYHNKHKVSAFHRDEECFSTCSADYSLDLTDLNKVQELFIDIKPDLVIHCAGLTNVDACEKEPALANLSNITVTENIARVCSNVTKLIYISTDQVYGETSDYSEDNVGLRPVNQYGKTKLQGEQKVQELCSNYIIVRTNIFGWNVKPGKVSSAEWIYYSLKKDEEITLFIDYTFSPVYTECLGDVIMQLIDKDFTGVINVGSQTPCSKYDFGMQLAEEFELNLSQIRKGSIAVHSFSAPRFRKLDMNVSKLSCLDITPPEYRLSISQFAQDRKEWEDHY